ncbi:MAG TPA: CDP-diacylglycerol--glycerol-3-phosphate 3-phosphatidyltransferase [Firmicutes bacterium]|nr:CDP-diacylglycerol--glycerol-3-phosphate 3-phosphatidyltransferase [Bacillota bacterium]
MNLPNWLTFIRIFLVPVFMVFAIFKLPYGETIATILFVIAALTDYLDGYLARKGKMVTKLGALIDPVADKLLITGALLSLVQLNKLNALIAMVILGREFAVMGLRLVAASYGTEIKVSKLGKLKTTVQFVAVTALMLGLKIGTPLIYISAIITVISGVEYYIKGAHVLKE